jgi:hypothetical protein
MPDPKNLAFPTVRSHHHFYDVGVYFYEYGDEEHVMEDEEEAVITGTVIFAPHIIERCT